MIFSWFHVLAVVVVYLVYDVLSIGVVFRFMFSLFPMLFKRYENIGRKLGVKYVRSDEWETNRKDTDLAVVGPSTVIIGFIGLDYHLTGPRHMDDIKVLKQRQLKFTRQIDVTKYVDSVLGKRLSLPEVENFLIDAWVPPPSFHTFPNFTLRIFKSTIC